MCYLPSCNQASLKEKIILADKTIDIGTGIVGYGVNKGTSCIGDGLSATWQKVARFIKNNWKPLLVYFIAWGVIVTGTGLMYGFEAVSLPFTIGLACGIGFGIIVGILTVKAFDSKGDYTLWNGLNYIIERLDSNGTRQIIMSIAVTVLLAAAVVFPYVLGAALGILIGNQLAVKGATEQDLGRDVAKVNQEKGELKKDLDEYQKMLKNFEALLDALKDKKDVDQVIREQLDNQWIALYHKFNDLKYRYDDLPKNIKIDPTLIPEELKKNIIDVESN